ncbi:MAG: ribonuclease D [Streptosporangiaceae bacterium]
MSGKPGSAGTGPVEPALASRPGPEAGAAGTALPEAGTAGAALREAAAAGAALPEAAAAGAALPEAGASEAAVPEAAPADAAPPGPAPEAAPPERTVEPLLEPRDGLPALVASADALRAAIEALANGTGPVAVDAERASGFRYGHRAFLVQFRRKGAGTVLIDPVACPDLSELDAALAGAEAVLHAASQDLPCLAELGYRPRQLFDTEVAGRLLGCPRVGLATMVESMLGLGLEKSHSAADWSTRPLPEEWLRYAALDVEVLVELRDLLAEQLANQGKLGWARQEFAGVLAAAPSPPRADPWRRTSGIHRVRNRRGLAVVRELWLERDKIARRRDMSPTKVLPDSAIVEAARLMPNSPAELSAVAGFSGRGARRHMPEWLRAIGRARALPDRALPAASAPAGDGPPPAHRWQDRDPEAARRLTAVRAVVAALADEHTMPAENLLPPDAVRRLAWQPPADLGPTAIAADLASYGARPWQVELAAVPIGRALLRILEKGTE